MDELIAWLYRQIATTENADHAATEGPWAIWEDLNHQGYITVGDEQGVLTDERPSTEECNPVAHVYAQHDADHIVLQNPAAALEDAKAKRDILETVSEVFADDLGPEANIMGARVAWTMALGYRHRPGWKREWGDRDFPLKH